VGKRLYERLGGGGRERKSASRTKSGKNLLSSEAIKKSQRKTREGGEGGGLPQKESCVPEGFLENYAIKDGGKRGNNKGRGSGCCGQGGGK